MIETIFWLSVFILIYAFWGYPIILKCISSFNRKRHCIKEDFTPSVSILLSVYNEENIIKEKIQIFLSLDYPRELL
jgi:cellulose synthase/poly-beta-1,6-N-acetylglucosamine synthase-like glycosyltransferase